MGTSTVTQDREPQKVGEPSSLMERTKEPRNCVKTQMMQRDCDKISISVSSLFSGILGSDKVKIWQLIFRK